MFKKWFSSKRGAVFGIVLLSVLLHAWAAWQLPLDFDEPVYLQAGFDYARELWEGDLVGVLEYPINTEHPPLVKLLYSLAVLVQGSDPDWDQALFLARGISSVFGVLATALMAMVSPLAGLFFALHTLVVKYTSQAYLEALPLFASLVAVFSIQASRHERDRAFWLSALALGLIAAGKYSYFPVLFVVLYLFLVDKRYRWASLALYLGVAALTFLALNPALWIDPVGSLVNSVRFHAQYSQSAHVQTSGYPWYQPLLTMSSSMGFRWHPQVFIYFGFDGLVFLLAVLGLPREWRERRWVFLWIVAGLLFLLAWPTKWPQYTLLVVPALCLAGAATLEALYKRIQEEDTYWNWVREMIPTPGRGLTALVILLVAFVTFGEMANTVRQAMLRRGWWHLSTANTAMPSNTIYTILAAPERQMILTSERGAAVLELSEDTGLPEDWQVFTPADSGLPNSRVLSGVRDASGRLWFGTQAGLAVLADGEWRAYRAQDMGLAGDQVEAVAVDRAGQVWVGTQSGLAVFDGQGWEAYTAGNSDLSEEAILSLVVQPAADGDQIWLGTRQGVHRLDAVRGEWTDFAAQENSPGAAAVDNLMVDAAGQVWATTLTAGLYRYDGQNWTAYRVSNSEIPSNTVTSIYETEPGIYWIATALPTEVGGLLTRFDGDSWRTYTDSNSGFSGAEPLSMALDAEGRLWIGTRTSGIDIYQFSEENGSSE